MRSAWKVWLMGALMLALALVLANCKQNANKAQFDQQKEAVKARIQASIARIDSTVDMLENAKERGSDVSGNDNAKESRNDSLDIRIQALKERKDILQARIDSVEQVSDERWEAYQNEVNQNLNDVDNDVRNNSSYYYNDTMSTRGTMPDTMGSHRSTTGTGTTGR